MLVHTINLPELSKATNQALRIDYVNSLFTSSLPDDRSNSASYVEVTITSRLVKKSTLKHCTVVLSLNDTEVRDGLYWRQLIGEVTEEICDDARSVNTFTIYDAKGTLTLAILRLLLLIWQWPYILSSTPYLLLLHSYIY